MRAILQRVESASVTVDGEIIGAIGRGWLALVGVASGSSPEDAEKLAEKTAQLRAFSDAEGKMNLSVEDVRGAILAVSNFTLYADCRKGRRPSFVGAASPEKARPLFDTYVNGLRARGIKAETGRFGADMKVSLVNDGPVTLILEI